MRNKIFSLFVITLLLLFVAFFVNLFFNCITLHSSFDVDYNELKYAELTFEKYELIKQPKSGNYYEIYFKEYDKPFEISNITKKGLNKEVLNKLDFNEKITVYYRVNSSGKYLYAICEMKSESMILIELSDYKKANQENQVIGMILCPVMVILGVFLLVLYIRWSLNENNFFTQIKEKKESELLGKVKIEYIKDGNVIRIYNSLEVCSLVINGNVVDKYVGFVATPFCIKGKVVTNYKDILVEAKMGHLFIKLYYDGKVVGKKFMGLG